MPRPAATAVKPVTAITSFNFKAPYDIAVNKQPGGTFGLTTDCWQGHVEQQAGPNFGRLLQLYGVHKTTAEARKKGYSVLRQPQRNGTIKLVLLGA